MTKKNISLVDSLIPIFSLIVLLTINVIVYGEDSLSGANQLALLFSAAIASLFGVKNKISWKHIMKKVSDSISSTTPAIIILLLIGALSGTWLISGVVPSMVYYGF